MALTLFHRPGTDLPRIAEIFGSGITGRIAECQSNHDQVTILRFS